MKEQRRTILLGRFTGRTAGGGMRESYTFDGKLSVLWVTKHT